MPQVAILTDNRFGNATKATQEMGENCAVFPCCGGGKLCVQFRGVKGSLVLSSSLPMAWAQILVSLHSVPSLSYIAKKSIPEYNLY